MPRLFNKTIDKDVKLSSVQNGTFIPPSPPQRESILDKAHEGGFVISRESFDRYRRSFDIRPENPHSPAITPKEPQKENKKEKEEKIDEEFEEVVMNEPKRRFWQRKKRRGSNELMKIDL